MLKTSLFDFKERMSVLKNHFLIYEKQERLIRLCCDKSENTRSTEEQDFLDLFIPAANGEKELEYISNIIYMYGALECFIEKSIKEYIIELNKIIPSVGSLLGNKKDIYLENLMKFHSRLKYKKFSYLNIKDIADCLNAFVYGDSRKILEECFLPLTGNYTHAKITEAISNLPISNSISNLKHYEPLCSYLKGLGNTLSDNFFCAIDDITERRNEVAHNGKPVELQNNNVLQQNVETMEFYAEALTSFLNDALLKEYWREYSKLGAQVIKKAKYYANPDVYSFIGKDVRIKVGETVLGERKRGKYPYMCDMIIQEIREKKGNDIVRVESILSSNEVEFSIKFNRKIVGVEKFLFLPFPNSTT